MSADEDETMIMASTEQNKVLLHAGWDPLSPNIIQNMCDGQLICCDLWQIKVWAGGSLHLDSPQMLRMLV